jgi:hypothetical protein
MYCAVARCTRYTVGTRVVASHGLRPQLAQSSRPPVQVRAVHFNPSKAIERQQAKKEKLVLELSTFSDFTRKLSNRT